MRRGGEGEGTQGLWKCSRALWLSYTTRTLTSGGL